MNELKIKLLNYNKKIEIITITCDQSDVNSREKLFNIIKNLEIDKAILNAGYIDEGSLITKTDKEIESIIRTNCEGTILIAKHLIELAKTNQTKLQILVVSSMSAFYPMPNMAIYAATKAMLLNFFLAINNEIKQYKMHITVLCPSGIYTTQAMKEAIKSQGLSGRLSSFLPEKIAKIGLKALQRKKQYIIPGYFNKFLKITSLLVPKTLIIKQIGKKWEKSQTKRGMIKN